MTYDNFPHDWCHRRVRYNIPIRRRQRVRYGSKVRRKREAETSVEYLQDDLSWPPHPGLDEPFSTLTTLSGDLDELYDDDDQEEQEEEKVDAAAFESTYFPPESSRPGQQQQPRAEPLRSRRPGYRNFDVISFPHFNSLFSTLSWSLHVIFVLESTSREFELRYRFPTFG